MVKPTKIPVCSLDPVDEATMDGFSNCLSMVHQHIRELRAELCNGSLGDPVEALDRLYNRIAEDTK